MICYLIAMFFFKSGTEKPELGHDTPCTHIKVKGQYQGSIINSVP